MSSRLSAAAALAIFASVLASSPVMAHADLQASDPAVNAVLEASPTEIALTFNREVDGSFTVINAVDEVVATGTLDLDIAERNVLSAKFMETAPGTYTVSWAVMDVGDGDTTAGEPSFIVRGQAPSGGDESPDTAIPDTDATTLAGLLCLAAALGLAFRRVAVFIGR
jgi:copper resistance protein C